ncbi:MAG: stage III sporulation protein AD [Blautia sp.]|nr:stage III sporulation protein AD [Blautia sp.]MDY5031010.1 SpoIIIAC/SpoIIIAD family protein [Blautia sp.]
MDIAKVSLIGMGGVILCFLLKGTRPEYASFVTMGIGLLILGLAVGKLKYLFESLESLKEILPVSSENISVLAKMIGITYIGQFSAGICRDAGYQATGAQIELFCKLSILVLSIPVMMALLETIREFLV